MIKASGIINKQGQQNMMGLGYWPERFFDLDRNIFAYYADGTKSDLKGLYRLGKNDTVEVHDGVLTLTSTFYKDFTSFGEGIVQKLNMKFGDRKQQLEFWKKNLLSTIEHIRTSQFFTGKCLCGKVEWTLFGHSMVETTCHCGDCAFFQGTTPCIMFAEGSLSIVKGNEFLHMTTNPQSGVGTMRAFCKNCHLYCFGDFKFFGAVGVPINRIQEIDQLPSKRTKYHLHYGKRVCDVKDGQRKFFDLPSSYGGSGNIVDDEGNLIGHDSRMSTRPGKSSVQLLETGEGQVALVTGGNRGIGFEICKQLAEFGFEVLLSGRDKEKVEKAASELKAKGLKVEPLIMDVTSDDSVAAAVQTFSAQYNKLDVLVNNVGGGYDWSPTASTINLNEAQDTMRLNLFSVWRVTQAYTPYLKAAPPGARIIMVGSGAGAIKDEESGFGFTSIGNGTVSAYGVSKMAVNGLTVKFSLEFKDDAIMVNSTCPGYTDSAGTGQGRPVSKGAASIVWAAKLAPDGPTGGFFRDGKALHF